MAFPNWACLSAETGRRSRILWESAIFCPLLLCVGAEFGCSVLLLLGFLTRLAALILIINMCVALFLVLGLSGWGAQELAAIYLLIYLTIFYTGPGKFSLDAWWLRRDCKIEVE